MAIFCQVQVQDLLIYLYGLCHGIYGEGHSNDHIGGLYHRVKLTFSADAGSLTQCAVQLNR